MDTNTSPAEPRYLPPSGNPLGTNRTFTIGAFFVIPILKLLTKRDWRGAQNIPAQGPMIAISNHISYADSLVFAHYLYGNGRAVRFLAKSSLFKIPVVGRILRNAEQVPVDRVNAGARALPHALAFLRAGHCLGVYPEGTLTRDPLIWPMVAKTGLARLAVMSKVPVIPCAQWGAQEILAPYAKLPRIWRRRTVVVVAGPPLDFSPWFGEEENHEAMVEATRYAMAAITQLLEEIRGGYAPAQIFDPHESALPRFGNFKKEK